MMWELIEPQPLAQPAPAGVFPFMLFPADFHCISN
jgi:hypothetical protein